MSGSALQTKPKSVLSVRRSYSGYQQYPVNTTMQQPVAAVRGPAGTTPAAVSLLDFMPPGERSKIQDLTSTRDVSSYVQTALDEGVPLLVPDGNFMMGNAVKLGSNTSLTSVSAPGRAVFMALPGMNAPVMIDVNVSSSGTGVYAQSNVIIDGITFDGSSRSLSDFKFLLRLLSIDGLTIRNCKFQNNLYGLVGIGGCRNVSLHGCEWTNWGKLTATPEGGPALWLAGNPTSNDDTPTTQVRGSNLYFHDGRWAACYDFSNDSVFVGVNIINTMESGFFNQLNSPDGLSISHVYTGFTVENVQRQYISSAAFEIYADHTTISNFSINGTDDAGIKINSRTDGIIVTDGHVWNAVRHGGGIFPTYDNYGQIQCIQLPGQTSRNITINNVTIGKTGVTPFSRYAIAVHSQDTGRYQNVKITGNNVVNGYTTAPFNLDGVDLLNDVTSAICSNVGASDVLTPFNALIKRDNLIGGSDELNAVENGRFERGAVGWTYSTSYWNINNDQTNALSGNYVAVNTDTSGLQRQFDSNYSACEAGDKIYVGAWLKTSASYTATNTMALILWSDKDKNFLSSSLGTNYTTAQTSYVLSSVTGTAPANARYWQVRLLAQKTVGTTYFDNVYSQRLRDASQLLLDNTVTYAKFQQVAASSLVGNATGSLANATGITLGATLAFSGSALQTAAMTGDVTTSANSFATTIANNAVSNAKFRQGAALSVVGVTGNATANVADIAGTANQVLRVNSGGTALSFGAIDVSQSAAVTGIMAAANGGTGNGFTAFTGPASTTKTFTLPNASDTLAALGQNQTFTGANTFNGAVTTKASASGGANLNIPNGTAPTSPNSGDMWTTTQSVEFSINGSTFGVVPLFKCLSANATGANQNTVQPWFPSAGGVTLEGSTTYRIRGKIAMNHGTTSRTLAISFGGTATLTSILYWSRYSVGLDSGAATIYFATVDTASSTVINSAQTGANEDVEIEGIVRINGGGTFIPQFTFSADPTGTITIHKNSFFILEKMGSDTVVSNGTWA